MTSFKTLLFLLLSFFTGYDALCQKPVVAILPFVYSIPDNKPNAEQLQGVAVECLNAQSSIQLVDRSKDPQLVQELNNQIREISANSNIHVAQGEVSGAQEMIVGNLTSATAELQTGTAKYAGNISYTLQILDVATGKVKTTKNFVGSTKPMDAISKLFNKKSAAAGNLLLADTKSEAIVNAINATKKDMADWLNTQYPPDAKILNIDTKDGKGMPETVSVVGLSPGITKGTTIFVSEITILKDGDKQFKKVNKIGEMKVIENQGEVTECKITDGASAIAEKMTGNAKLEFSLKKKLF